jgi:hypothetical protein
MAPGPDTLSALRERRAALAEQFAQALRADAPLADAQALHGRLELIDGVLAAAQPPRRTSPWGRQAVALAVVALLVTAAAWVRMPRVEFALEVETGAVQWAAAQAGQLAGQSVAGDLRAEGFDRLESADAALLQSAQDNGAAAFSLRAERLALRSLSYGSGARIDLQTNSPALRLAVDGAAHSVQMEFGGTVQTSFGGAPRQTVQVPVVEWLRLRAEASPTELWFARRAEQPLRWRGLPASSLRFVERAQDGAGPVRLESALRRATLKLPATERELKLSTGSGLSLDGLVLERCEFVVGDTIVLTASGSARRIATSTGGFERSLSPSVLEYLSHNHGLGLFWSAAGLLWGLSAGLRKLWGAAW